MALMLLNFLWSHFFSFLETDLTIWLFSLDTYLSLHMFPRTCQSLHYISIKSSSPPLSYGNARNTHFYFDPPQYTAKLLRYRYSNLQWSRRSTRRVYHLISLTGVPPSFAESINNPLQPSLQASILANQKRNTPIYPPGSECTEVDENTVGHSRNPWERLPS